MQTPHDGAPAGLQQTLSGEAVIADFILPPAPDSNYSVALAALRYGDTPKLRRIKSALLKSFAKEVLP